MEDDALNASHPENIYSRLRLPFSINKRPKTFRVTFKVIGNSFKQIHLKSLAPALIEHLQQVETSC